jgi:hypothetical protein
MREWMHRVVIGLVVGVVSVGLAGCGGGDQEETGPTTRPAEETGPGVDGAKSQAAGGGAPAGTPEAPSATEDAKTARFGGFIAPKPAAWTWYPPETRMRVANYAVPGVDGADQAHVVIYEGIGGSPEMNIQRWAMQFRSPDGGAVEPVVETIEVAGMPVTLVELKGEHKATRASAYTPDQIMLGALIEAPEAPIQITLVGPSATVEANREAFRAMIEGMERVDNADRSGAEDDP